MNGKFFTKSLKFLIVAVLILFAFFREPKYQWAYFAVFGAWGAILLIRILAGRFVRLGRFLKKTVGGMIAAMRRKVKEVQREDEPQPEPFATEQTEPDNSADKLLLGHLSCRITDKLKAVFPDAAWYWLTENPESIARGGTGRIRIEDADEYTHADVTVDNFFRLSFAMMKIRDLRDVFAESDTAADEDETAEPQEPVQVNVADWYEWVGKEALQEVITELNSRGYSRVFIKESGEVYVVEDGNEAVKAALKEMPEESRWAELVEVLAANGLKGIINNDRLAVTWA